MCVSHVSQEPDANVSPKQNTNEDYDVEDYRKKVENLEKLVEITSYLNSTIVLED